MMQYDRTPERTRRLTQVVAGATRLLIAFGERDADGIKTAAYLIEVDLVACGLVDAKALRPRRDPVTRAVRVYPLLEQTLVAAAQLMCAYQRDDEVAMMTHAAFIVGVIDATRFADRVRIVEGSK